MSDAHEDEPELLEELGRALGHDPSAAPPPDRVAAVRAAAERMSGPDDLAVRRGSRRRFLLTGGVAAGVGAVAGYLAHGGREDEEPPAAVPMEQITFAGAVRPDVEVSSAALINHTWGTELVLDLTGLAAGTAYDVVFETVSGPVGAGSLLAVPDVLMKCRFNAAPLRADVRAIEVRDPDGAAVLRSDLPSA